MSGPRGPTLVPLPAKHGISAKMRVHRAARDVRSFTGSADVRIEPQRVQQWPAPSEYPPGSFKRAHENGWNWSLPHFAHGGATSARIGRVFVSTRRSERI